MQKKSWVALAIAAVILITGGFYFYGKYEQRQARLKLYEQSKNTRAEELKLTMLEGWTNKEIGQYLEKQSVVKASDFLSAARDFDFSGYVDVLPAEAKTSNLQGFLYPDTYQIFKTLADPQKTPPQKASREIIAKMLDNFVKRMPAGAKMLAQKQGLSLYEAVILASIVEKETNSNQTERQTVAGIFYNRLKAGMPLQSDATVNYATGKNLAAPMADDLKINSPYNTYLFKGLPPGPICNPSASSLQAVLNPVASEYFYYLHDQTTGQVYYSKTYEEHLINKAKYLK